MANSAVDDGQHHLTASSPLPGGLPYTVVSKNRMNTSLKFSALNDLLIVIDVTCGKRKNVGCARQVNFHSLVHPQIFPINIVCVCVWCSLP